MSKEVKRLFAGFEPDHYDLNLHPSREAEAFSGNVVIKGKKKDRPSQRLTLHQKNLKITKAEVIRHDKSGDHTIEIDRINTHAGYDEVRLHAKEMLYPGQYSISLEFNGKITKQMNGIYPCFFEHKGKQQQLIATQFESHYAREVFPCIDEPEAKATFQLGLTVTKGETVISNTPIEKQIVDKKLQTVIFETTPKMSTYLLAFAYGNFQFKEAKTKAGVVVRTYATPDNVGFTDFALDVAVKCLEFYNEYFDTDYPLPKCDFIALPDFASGAMENWGCITFREQTLLVDPANSSLPTKQFVAMVVAHELAHQWFGNLVTMRWWTDLWLNEGFASWIEYLAVDHIFPDWQMWTQFIVDEQHQALRLDALEHTHPIEVAVNDPEEIHSIFDTISYSKGASIINMLHSYLGADNFRDGLRYYLKKHEYANTDTVDLWAALQEVSKKQVKDFMHAWTAQAGYPLLSANVDNTGLEVSQERFYLNPKAKVEPSNWPVPLLINDSDQQVVLKTKRHKLETDQTNKLKLNRGQSGFYRTLYNATHQHRLGELVHRGQLSPLDRLGVLSDMFEAAKAGHSGTAEALTLMGFYEHEDNASVWDIMAANLGHMRGVMDDDDLRDLMKPFVRKLIATELKRLGWQAKKTDSHFDKLLRPVILGMASIAEEPTVIKWALDSFNKMKRPQDVHPDLRGVVYATAVRHGGQPEFDKLWNMHNKTLSSEERSTIASAITGFKQPALYKKALGLIDTSEVRLQDVSAWVAYSFMNRHAKVATWDWMVEHWNWLDKNLGSDLSFFRFPIYAGRAFSDIKFLPKYTRFFKSVMRPALERPFNQGVEMIEWQSAWKERDLKTIKAFFKNQAY